MRYVTAVIGFCGLGLLPMDAYAEEPKLPFELQQVRSVLEYFRKNDIHLETRDGGLVVVKPATEKYWVTVSFRFFAADATEQAMRDELQIINLAYYLNVKARLAMSYPGERGQQPGEIRDTEEAKRQRKEIAVRLLKLFKEYDPAAAKDR